MTVTRVLDRKADLRRWAAELNEGLASSEAKTPALPDGARPLLGLELTTHTGHFIGAATSNLLLFEMGSGSFLRDTGCWDPMPPHLAIAYKTAGAEAQEAFWGSADPERSMLVQMADVE